MKTSIHPLAHLVAALIFGLSWTHAARAEGGSTQNIDLGEASVMSQQGQRLKIAVPFGSDAGDKFSLLRFEVQSVDAGAGQTAPSPRGFTISKPEHRNVIFLQSAETVNASNLKLVLAVAGSPGKTMAYDLAVPPASATVPVATTPNPAVKIKTVKRKGKFVSKARHSRVRAIQKRR
jgi:hypothetical protein